MKTKVKTKPSVKVETRKYYLIQDGPGIYCGFATMQKSGIRRPRFRWSITADDPSARRFESKAEAEDHLDSTVKKHLGPAKERVRVTGPYYETI